MRTVYIDFTRSRKTFPIFSWAVQLFERARYSHVRLHWRSNWFDWSTFEASGSSVKLIGAVGFRNYPVKLVHRYEVKLNDAQYKRMVGMLRYAGVSYGAKQVFGMALQRLFKLKKNPFGDRKYTMVCSELIAYLLLEVMDISLGANLDDVGPRKLKEYMDTRPDVFRKLQ
jgi:hypothetical protein